MKFLIQHNLMNEKQLLKVKEAVKDYPHEFVGLIPFSREITSEAPLEGRDYIPYGSTLLTTLAADLEWKGLSFDLSKMNYRHFMTNRNDMLNGEFIFTAKEAICYLAALQVSDPSGKIFSRPSEDLKHYSGGVFTVKELIDMLVSMTTEPDNGGTYHLDSSKEIVLAQPKEIQAEFRYFIVDGKVVSGSMYCAHKQLRQERMEDVPDAQQLADIWLPHKNVVMDVALVNDELKVIEFNCINSSGFYDNDVSSIFKALWEYYERY